MKLKDVAAVIRSKNAGPYELTFDIVFPDKESYEKAISQKIINPEIIAQLYSLSLDQVLDVIEFSSALAIKATIIRPIGSGNIGDRDIYGAQQHAPLMDIEIDI